ncbi:MAG: SDR family NAD(P)-dependent oxidoreductase [Bacteroidetes bacterium]|nr:SDR family NAD(P)-dependent oxidoreductase [Bacteroidota bacterium]MBU2586115.1 SDR family NAD(P)-dependent oxidoreductase [Bacteroidota bacterium]
MKLRDKVVLITGASEGIGRALAIELAEEKSKLVLLARNEERLSELTSELKSYTDVTYQKCDVRNPDNVKDSIEKAIKTFGRIDVAVLNAGIGYRMKVIDFDYERTKKIYDTNLYGALFFFEYLIPIFKEQKSGMIVGVSSMADVRGFPGSAAYCSSKSALTTFLESSRVELSRYNIKVITVRPGFVDTNMIKNNKFKMRFVLDVKNAANKILRGIEREKKLIQFPFIYVLLTSLVKFLPVHIFDFLSAKHD